MKSDFLDIAEMERVYSEQGFGKERIGFGEKPALLIIDFQYGLTDSQYGLGGGTIPTALQETAKLLKSIRAKRIPVFYSVVAYRKDALDAKYFLKKLPSLKKFTHGTRYSEIDKLVEPEKGDFVIYKQYQSCFSGTNLSSHLTSMSIDTVFITGCSTSSCVRSTTADVLAYGFRPIVIEECVGDRSVFAHRVTLMEMNAKIADVVKVKEVLEYLGRIG